MAEAKEVDVFEKHVQDAHQSDTGKKISLNARSSPQIFASDLPQIQVLTCITVGSGSEVDVLRAAGIGIAEDDPTEPILTLRMWVLGIGFCIVASGLNTLYILRTPSLTISASVALLLAHPLGRLWERFVPSWNVPLGNCSFNLNPVPLIRR
jgi:hypothetical protein